MSMITNRRDLDFLMFEVLDIELLLKSHRYQDYDRDTITAVLDTAQSIAEDKFLPCANKLDASEPVFDGERVHIISEVGEALSEYAEAGFFSAAFDTDIGGMQMPFMVSSALMGLFTCANTSIASYAYLTQANANMLNAFGTKDQRSKYLPAMLAGKWFGTMCISEPQAGSSLSDIRTKAEPDSNNLYLISGTKMWITGGDQNLSENIVHMVLARIPEAPPGVKGLSLFVVPKHRIKSDGSIGDPNNVALAGLNHKMGHRGTTNAILNFGENGPCYGELVGEPNKGLSYMFHMMNEARIGMGQGATMSGLAGFLYSLDYARNRPQGRLPHEKNPSSPQVNIIEHADVKRLLMAQKAYVEGGLALVLYCAGLVDQLTIEELPEEKNRIGLLLELLTPVAKSWPSEYCLEANKHAIQVLGGYGYSREYPVERFYRDNRLNHIHEGTYAIHGIDLLGRKVWMQRGGALDALEGAMNETIEDSGRHNRLLEYAEGLTRAIAALRKATNAAGEAENSNLMLANATVYLEAFGHVTVAWLWLLQAIKACDGLDNAAGDEAFYRGKLASCRYFYRYELPGVYPKFDLVSALDDTTISMAESDFVGH